MEGGGLKGRKGWERLKRWENRKGKWGDNEGGGKREGKDGGEKGEEEEEKKDLNHQYGSK